MIKLLVTDTTPSPSGGVGKEPVAVDLLVVVEDASHSVVLLVFVVVEQLG
jgi:hypothetical protein